MTAPLHSLETLVELVFVEKLRPHEVEQRLGMGWQNVSRRLQRAGYKLPNFRFGRVGKKTTPEKIAESSKAANKVVMDEARKKHDEILHLHGERKHPAYIAGKMGVSEMEIVNYLRRFDIDPYSDRYTTNHVKHTGKADKSKSEFV